MTEFTASTEHEIEQTPEYQITQDLVARIDRGLAELSLPPRDKRGWGSCNFVPDAVNYCAIQDAAERGYKIDAHKFQASDLHMVASGNRTPGDVTPNPNEWWDGKYSPEQIAEMQNEMIAYYADPDVNHVVESAFRHGFNVLTINEKPFLIDLTFAQFSGEDGTLCRGADQRSSGVPSDHPMAEQLRTNGFVPLTDASLRQYMRFLCTEDAPYLDGVDVSLLGSVRPLDFDVDDNELMGKIPSSYRQAV